MSEYPPPAEPPKSKGDLVRTFRLPSTLETGAMSLSNMDSASRKAEQLGGYARHTWTLGRH